MVTKSKILAYLVSLGILGGVAVNPAMAKLSEDQSQKTSQFSKIEQPLLLKVGVTLGGVVLIGAELWWFLLSKHQSNKS
jgi:plastocyanin domain-containing protein